MIYPNYVTLQASVDDSKCIAGIVNGAMSQVDYFKEGLEPINAENVGETIQYQPELHWYVLKENRENEESVSTVLYETKGQLKGSIRMFCRRAGAELRGLGAKLLNEVIKKEKTRELSLWCADVCGLVSYYERLGFTKTTKQKSYDPFYLKPEMKGKISLIKMRKSVCTLNNENSNGIPVYKMPHVREKKLFDISGEKISDPDLEALLQIIEINPANYELRVTKSLLSGEQTKRLMELSGANEWKGFRIITTEGDNLGSVHTNWETYANQKREAYQDGMYETTRVGLDEYRKHYQKNPEFIVDFGAGTGKDTINLGLENCPKIWAVDGDEPSLQTLRDNLKNKPCQGAVQCITSPFIFLDVKDPVDLLVSSHTLPYRRPMDFPSCFEKCSKILQIGGFLAAHFFGPITGKYPDPGLTYHTEKELRELLSHNFEIVWFKKDPEVTPCKIYGGEAPPWGDLFHVVAKKIR